MAQDQLIKELCSCTDNNGCSVEKGKGKRISDLKKKKGGGLKKDVEFKAPMSKL